MNKLMAIVFLAAVCALAAYPPAAAQKNQERSSYSKKEIDLRASLRRIFDDHITWQRIYTVETLAGGADAVKARDRLDRNGEETGNAFKPFYGDDTGSKVSDLFKQHVQLLADYTNAAKTGGDTVPLTGMLMANADAAAALLGSQNPAWKKDDLSELLRAHSNDMKVEIDQQVKSPGSLDIERMDRSTDHAMELADTLAFGLMEQFKEKLK